MTALPRPQIAQMGVQPPSFYDKKNLFIDFEFNRVWARHVNLVCVVVGVSGTHRQVWLHNDIQAQRQFAAQLHTALQTHRLITFGAIAECRSLRALGLNPEDYEIVDLWAEMRQLHNHNNRHQYGRYFNYTGEHKSVPPHIVPGMNKGKDMTEIGDSLVAAMGFYLGIQRDSAHKNEMRRIIIEDLPDYTPEQRKAIMAYCEEDVAYLPALYTEISLSLHRETGWSAESVLMAQLQRGGDSASMAECEAEGIPLDLDAAHHLSNNVEEASNDLINDLVTKHYPFFVKNPDGGWTQSYAQAEAYIRGKGLDRLWPTTATGKFQTDEDTLEDFSGYAEVNAWRKTRKVLGQLKWFRDEAWGYFYDHVDIMERRLRCWLNPYGTQSNRNAPPAKVFVPAMSNWLRCLIRPMKGWAITGTDWSSQEFAIAAILSGDPDMCEAYRMGDPYVYFALKAGAIPQGVNTKWVKKPEMAPEAEREVYAKHNAVRDLFKSTCLAGDTLVLTSNGIKPITKITADDYLWDGVEYVTHEGVICNGTRETGVHAGIRSTGDHQFLCEDGTWAKGEELTGEVPGKTARGFSWPSYCWAEVRRLGGNFRRDLSKGR